MKDTICLIAGIVGGFIATLLGGWDSALATLVVFMGIDFVTGRNCSNGQIQTQRKRYTQQHSRLGWSCEKILYSSYGSGRRENRYSHRHKLHQRCSLHQLLSERTALHY